MRVAADDGLPDASVVPRSPSGVFLCLEPCGRRGTCRMGILAQRLDDDSSVSFDIECPSEYQESLDPPLAHATWTAGIMSEMCGQLPLWLGIIAFTGTVTTRYQAAVQGASG